MVAPQQPASGPRVAIVLSHPIQYYSPWFRWLQANTALTFRVFYLSDFGLKPALDKKFQKIFAWDVDLTSGYDWEVVPNTSRTPDTLSFRGLRNPELSGRLAAWKPDAVLLFGYKYETHLKLIAWARLHGVPLIFRGDSHLLGRDLERGFKKQVLHFLYGQFAAITYVGRANYDYFHTLGVAKRKLFHAPHAVDASRFDPSRADLQAAATTLRKELGLPSTTRVVLFAGKLISSKQPRALLKAFLSLRPRETALVFVGDGPEKEKLESLVAQHPHAPIHFLPFANQSEMPARYLLADLFVLPSRGFYETWGLAVNEAMHLGVPCLVSDHVGCQRDLVTDGECGWVFPAEDANALEAKLAQALETLRSEPERIRTAVKARISGYTYRQTSEGLLAAVGAVTR